MKLFAILCLIFSASAFAGGQGGNSGTTNGGNGAGGNLIENIQVKGGATGNGAGQLIALSRSGGGGGPKLR